MNRVQKWRSLQREKDQKYSYLKGINNRKNIKLKFKWLANLVQATICQERSPYPQNPFPRFFVINLIMNSQTDKKLQNTGIFTCYTFPFHFLLQSKYIPNNLLHIDRKSRKLTIKEKSNSNFIEKNYVVRQFSTLLGITQIEGIHFLIFCDECKLAGGDNIKIYEVASIFFVCYLKEAELVYTGRKQEVLKKTHEVNEFFSRGFYFSYEYNITQTLEFQNNPYAQEFAWNKVFIKPLKKYASKEWICPLIQGYVGTFLTDITGVKIEYYLVSRRSWKKGGTRYFDRGVNEQGYVANFVETEQILFVSSNFMASDVQIRGSVPIYFQQTGFATKVKINRSNELARESFKAHFEYCLKRYGRVFIVNLLDTQKGGQKVILQQYQKHIKQINQPSLKYYYYNFHQKCPNNSFHNVNKAIDSIRQMRRNLGYYIVNKQTNSALNRQMGVFRTNCLDCLDRTNVFQSKIAADTLECILSDLGISIQEVTKSKFIEEMDKNKDTLDLTKEFKSLWADNGDQISFHYTGTGSTHSDFTRSGSRGITGIFKHKAKTITRFYNQNFYDFNKMKLVDLVLESKTSELQNERIPSMLKAKENVYCSYKDINIEVLSWKISKQAPCKQLFPFKGSDIYIIGLQQIESNTVVKWTQYLAASIEKSSSDKYTEFIKCYGNNNFCVGFIKSYLKSSLSNIDACTIKFSNILNYLSNKSATVIRFQLDDNSLAFSSCQLEYGSQYASSRIQNLKEIYSNAFQSEIVGKKKSPKFQTHHYQFLFGNVNMTINKDEKQLKQKVKQLIDLKQKSKTDNGLLSEIRLEIKNILKFDQFNNKDENTMILRNYQQPSILFIPNYKYEKGRMKLDETRSPGWADRVFYSSERHVQCVEYDTVEIYLSDHLPVLGQFKITVDKEDVTKKEEVYEMILRELQLEEPEPEEEEEFKGSSLNRITEKDIRAEDQR